MKNPFSGVRYLWKSQDIRRKLIVTLDHSGDLPVGG